jgi:hypothetical protein
MNVFLVKNLFDYEEVIPPPLNLPKDMISVYLTDSVKNANYAKKLGWDYSIVTDKFIGIIDKFKRRQAIAYINCFPHKFINIKFNFIFVCDSNILHLWENYNDYVSKCTNDKVLFITSGYYKGSRDTLNSEIYASNIERWSYNWDSILNRGLYYLSKMKESPSVCSAKYIGWNINHPKYKEISDAMYNEHLVHLQGNVILTYMSEIYKNDIFNYKCIFNYRGGKLNKHKYKA